MASCENAYRQLCTVASTKRSYVLHGDNDIRVPEEESEQVLALIRAQHGTVEAHYFPNEGHGFSKRENQIDALERTVNWLDRYLKNDIKGAK